MKIFKTVLAVVAAGILFVGCQEKAKSTSENAEKSNVSHEAAAPAPTTEPAVESKTSGGSVGTFTVADIFAKKAELNGKNVTVHGKVTKVNLGIMGKNWLHLQDGTGSAGTNDITVTTERQAKVNDKVAITGTLVTDKDFGAGYKYAVIIENATVMAE